MQQSERELGGTGNPQVLGVSHIQRDHKPRAHGDPNSRGARVKSESSRELNGGTSNPQVLGVGGTTNPGPMETLIPEGPG